MAVEDDPQEKKRKETEENKEEFDRMFYVMIKNLPNAPTFEDLKKDFDPTAVDIIVKTGPKS